MLAQNSNPGNEALISPKHPLRVPQGKAKDGKDTYRFLLFDNSLSEVLHRQDENGRRHYTPNEAWVVAFFVRKWDKHTQNNTHPRPIPFGWDQDTKGLGIGRDVTRSAMKKAERDGIVERTARQGRTYLYEATDKWQSNVGAWNSGSHKQHAGAWNSGGSAPGIQAGHGNPFRSSKRGSNTMSERDPKVERFMEVSETTEDPKKITLAFIDATDDLPLDGTVKQYLRLFKSLGFKQTREKMRELLETPNITNEERRERLWEWATESEAHTAR